MNKINLKSYKIDVDDTIREVKIIMKKLDNERIAYVDKWTDLECELNKLLEEC